MVPWLYARHALADGLYDTCTLVSENNRERTLGILARERVRICVAYAGVVDLDADLVRLRWGDLDVFDRKVFAGFPGDCSLFEGYQSAVVLCDDRKGLQENMGGKLEEDVPCK